MMAVVVAQSPPDPWRVISGSPEMRGGHRKGSQAERPGPVCQTHRCLHVHPGSLSSRCALNRVKRKAKRDLGGAESIASQHREINWGPARCKRLPTGSGGPTRSPWCLLRHGSPPGLLGLPLTGSSAATFPGGAGTPGRASQRTVRARPQQPARLRFCSSAGALADVTGRAGKLHRPCS